MGMIGPTFARELEAAGLLGIPISWEDNGNITGLENLTDAQRTALDAVLAVHNPAATVPNDTIDTEALNAALMQEGSIIRALAEFVFRLSKGQIPIDPARTPQQFRTILKSFMRS